MDKLKAVQVYHRLKKLDKIVLDYITLEEEEDVREEVDGDNTDTNNDKGSKSSEDDTGTTINDWPLHRHIPVKLFQDIKTCLWSTYRMIRRLLELRKEIDAVANPQNSHYTPFDHFLNCGQHNGTY